MKVTFRRAPAGSVRSRTFIMPIPTREATRPTITVRIGSATPTAALFAMRGEVAAIAIVATIEPT